MIGFGKFRADLGRGFDLLKELDLGPYRNQFPITDQDTTDRLRNSTGYVETYNNYIDLQAYDILLEDGSILFFRHNLVDETLLSYGYLESPYSGLSYRQFVREYYGEQLHDDIRAVQEYDDYRAQLPLRSHVIPLRYDWSPSLYREGAHPAAHLHVGFETEMRLAVDALLTPVQFILLVVRHFYVTVWESTACDHAEIIREALSISDVDIAPQYRQGRDLLELRLIRAVATVTSVTVQPPRKAKPRR
jgi:hypothetical protein